MTPDRFPSAADLDEYRRRLDELRTAQAAGTDTEAMSAGLTAFMLESGFLGECCPTDEEGEPT